MQTYQPFSQLAGPSSFRTPLLAVALIAASALGSLGLAAKTVFTSPEPAHGACVVVCQSNNAAGAAVRVLR